jgi:SAM-dependent methyltransferase
MRHFRKPRNTEDVYRKVPIDEIPWNREDPPEALVTLVENGMMEPCRCIDLGCGTGNYAIFLSRKGFTVTGIDISPKAIILAKENAKEKGASCEFIVADVLNAPDHLHESFDFAYDWEVLHHVFPQKRKRYMENVHRLLKPGGKYLSVCFSNNNPQFRGKGKYRHTPLGTFLYFSSERELDHLFSRFFTILELKTMEIEGKTSPHLANYALMERN